MTDFLCFSAVAMGSPIEHSLLRANSWKFLSIWPIFSANMDARAFNVFVKIENDFWTDERTWLDRIRI